MKKINFISKYTLLMYSIFLIITILFIISSIQVLGYKRDEDNNEQVHQHISKEAGEKKGPGRKIFESIKEYLK